MQIVPVYLKLSATKIFVANHRTRLLVVKNFSVNLTLF